MRQQLLAALAFALGPIQSAGQTLPQWAGPDLDPFLPLGGIPLAANVTAVNIFRVVPPFGTFNTIPRVDFHERQFLVSWQNKYLTNTSLPITSIFNIYYSQSMDGETWTPTDGTNILFPSLMFTGNNPPYSATLAPAPTLHINGSFYAACTVAFSFSLYPDPYQNLSVLLLRQINTPGLDNFGQMFWAWDSIPAGFENASKQYNIVPVSQMDAQTQADIATLSNWSVLPCGSASTGTLKCEACVNGCLQSMTLPDVTGLPSHYQVPNSASDMILYSSTAGKDYISASTRASPSSTWSTPVVTTFPDANQNRDAGVLSDGRIFVVANSMTNLFKLVDPLYVSTSVDGYTFNQTTTITSCSLPYFTASDQPSGCFPRYNTFDVSFGTHTPDATMVTASGFEGLWVTFSLNTEDIWLIRVPVASI
jgi:hypothetical protein